MTNHDSVAGWCSTQHPTWPRALSGEIAPVGNNMSMGLSFLLYLDIWENASIRVDGGGHYCKWRDKTIDAVKMALRWILRRHMSAIASQITGKSTVQQLVQALIIFSVIYLQKVFDHWWYDGKIVFRISFWVRLSVNDGNWVTWIELPCHVYIFYTSIHRKRSRRRLNIR